MFLPVIALLVPLCLLATSNAASTVVQVGDTSVTLPFARRVNLTGTLDLVIRDQARARQLAKQSGASTPGVTSDVGVTNAGVNYVASVGVGSPATYYSLIIDTGSSNTWVGAKKPYAKTNTSVKTSNKVAVSYGSGSFSGMEYMDTVRIASGLVIPGQSIGGALTSKGFDDVDGILGIGPVDLTIGSLSPATNSSIPTVTQNLFKRGAISAELVSISFEPTTVPSVKNGELTFGRTDSTKFTGPLTYVYPHDENISFQKYWGIDQSIRYGSSVRILDTTAGIVDTGTTLILLATDAFDRYCRATGAVLDPTTKLHRITPAQYANLKSLFFTIGGRTFELTANAQIWPRALNEFIGGEQGRIYLVVNDIGSLDVGEGFDFINGYTFLERFYSVFDTGKQRVGLATTPFTKAKSN